MKGRLFLIGMIILLVLCFFSAEDLAQAKRGAPAQYVGSERCAKCHKAIYANWKDTLHNKSQQPLTPTNDTVAVDWTGSVKLKAPPLPDMTVKLGRGPQGVYRATLVDAKDPAMETTYDIVRTYGGWGWKQRYHVKVGNHHYILPIQWNQATSRWVPYNPQNWYNSDGSLKKPVPANSFDMKCAGCHNTGLAFTKAEGGLQSSYSELNTGCERCHGPGSQHIKAPQAKGKIINPKKLAYERAIEVCGQCHNRGVSVPGGIHDFPWNDKENTPYKLGEVLANYYQFKPGQWGDPAAHSRQHHQQWNDFIKSKHFKAKVSCWDCHSPHGGPGENQLVKSDYNNNLCLSCHGKDKRFANPAAIRAHAKHNYAPETRGTGRCSGCHMVATAASAEAGDIHSHDFKIIKPSVSLALFKKDPKTVVPNSCTGCHKEWAKDLAGYEAGAAAYEGMFGK